MTSKKHEIKFDKKLREALNEDRINTIAKEVGWQQRKRCFKAMDLLGLMLGGQTNYQRSLTEMCQELSEQGVILTKQSLNDRFNKKSTLFFKRILQEVIEQKLVEENTCSMVKNFSSIKITDSISFQLPDNLATSYKGFGGGAKKAGIKTHYQVDITSGQHIDLELVNAASSDMSTTLIVPQKGDFHLFDLGYINLAMLKAIAGEGAFYLCRLKFNMQVWVKTEGALSRLDWSAQVNKMKAGEIKELAVCLGPDKKINCRIIIERVADQLANEKRRKLKTDKINKRKQLSKERLEFCALNVLITNIHTDVLDKQHAYEVYRLRWQIEIYFKTWKSYLNIDKIERMNIHRFNCTHFGTLIYIILTSKLFFFFKRNYWETNKVEISEIKAFKLLAKRKKMIFYIIFGSFKKARSDLSSLADNLLQNCIKERKQGKLRPYESICYILN